MKVATINANCDSEDEESYSEIKISEPDEIPASAHRCRRIVRPPSGNKDYDTLSNTDTSRSQDSVVGETCIDQTRRQVLK